MRERQWKRNGAGVGWRKQKHIADEPVGVDRHVYKRESHRAGRPVLAEADLRQIRLAEIWERIYRRESARCKLARDYNVARVCKSFLHRDIFFQAARFREKDIEADHTWLRSGGLRDYLSNQTARDRKLLKRRDSLVVEVDEHNVGTGRSVGGVVDQKIVAR